MFNTRDRLCLMHAAMGPETPEALASCRLSPALTALSPCCVAGSVVPLRLHPACLDRSLCILVPKQHGTTRSITRRGTRLAVLLNKRGEAGDVQSSCVVCCGIDEVTDSFAVMFLRVSLVAGEGNGDDDKSSRLRQHVRARGCVPEWMGWMHDLFISRSRRSCRRPCEH